MKVQMCMQPTYCLIKSKFVFHPTPPVSLFKQTKNCFLSCSSRFHCPDKSESESKFPPGCIVQTKQKFVLHSIPPVSLFKQTQKCFFYPVPPISLPRKIRVIESKFPPGCIIQTNQKFISLLCPPGLL